MCGKAAPPPQPQAPPAPIPKRDEKIDAMRRTQSRAASARASGYESTLLSGQGGDTSPAPVTKPVLGG